MSKTVLRKRGPGRPRKSDNLDRRKLILEAARRSFGESGYTGVSLREIASGAQVDVGLITHNFGSKFGLWKAIIDQAADHILGEIERFGRSALAEPAEERFAMMLTRYIDIMCDTPFLACIIAQDATQPGERFDYIFDRLAEPMRLLMIPLTLTGHDSCATRETSPSFFFFVLASAICMAVASREFIHRYDPRTIDDEFFRAELKRTMLQTITRTNAN